MNSADHANLTRSYEDLLLLRHSDPGARQVGLATNGYTVLSEGEAVYVDAPFDILLPLVQQITTKETPRPPCCSPTATSPSTLGQ